MKVTGIAVSLEMVIAMTIKAMTITQKVLCLISILSPIIIATAKLALRI